MKKPDRFGCGKLPAPVLAELLKNLTSSSPPHASSLVTGPGPGRDCAAVDTGSDNLLIVSGDPITFTADHIGRYAVIINANDIAATGAFPKWFFATLLFPEHTPPETVQTVFEELDDQCVERGIILAGGHTEITDAVSRPVVCGTMLGTVEKENYIDVSKAGEGDAVLMTKELALEGSAVLAREQSALLVMRGLPREELSGAEGFLKRISIVEEALLSASTGWVTGMHDITEGGLATALREFALAAGRSLLFSPDSIPVSPVTRHMCSILDIDPLGLLGSGSLLISCVQEKPRDLIALLGDNGIGAARIGTMQGRDPAGRVSADDGTALPVFETDEIVRALREEEGYQLML